MNRLSAIESLGLLDGPLLWCLFNAILMPEENKKRGRLCLEKMIVVGNDIYDEFIRDNGYYVDKTELIYDLVAKTRNKVTLFTRPRRFGKTLTLSMIESFFNKAPYSKCRDRRSLQERSRSEI